MRPVLMDGATGTEIWRRTDTRLPVWQYNFKYPDLVRSVAKDYADAGAQIVCANTFAVNYYSTLGTEWSTAAAVKAGLRLAREGAGGRAKVALDVGPLAKLVRPYGKVSEQEAEAAYRVILEAGKSEKPDYLILETFMDSTTAVCALRAARRFPAPVIVSFTFGRKGQAYLGESVSRLLKALSPFEVSAVGVNCSYGPDTAYIPLYLFRQHTDLPLFYKPNAGLPDIEGVYPFPPEAFARETARALALSPAFIGGCCGAGPAHIRELKRVLDEREG